MILPVGNGAQHQIAAHQEGATVDGARTFGRNAAIGRITNGCASENVGQCERERSVVPSAFLVNAWLWHDPNNAARSVWLTGSRHLVVSPDSRRIDAVRIVISLLRVVILKLGHCHAWGVCIEQREVLAAVTELEVGVEAPFR